MKTNELVKWAITDTLKVEVRLLSVEGDRARVRRDDRELNVRADELEREETNP